MAYPKAGTAIWPTGKQAQAYLARLASVSRAGAPSASRLRVDADDDDTCHPNHVFQIFDFEVCVSYGLFEIEGGRSLGLPLARRSRRRRHLPTPTTCFTKPHT
jgi:hypothetical protein